MNNKRNYKNEEDEEEEEYEEPLELEHCIGFTGKHLHSCCFHPKNSKTIIYSIGSVVVIENTDDPHSQIFLRKHDSEVSKICISPSGNYLASSQIGSTKTKLPIATIIIWNLKTLSPIHIIKKHLNIVYSLSFSHDENFLVSSGEKNICIWEMETGLLSTSTQTNKPHSFVKFTPKESNFNKRRPKYKIITGCEDFVQLFNYDYEVTKMQFVLKKKDFAVPGRMVGFKRWYHSITTDDNGDFAFVGNKSSELIIFQMKNTIFRTSVLVGIGGILDIVYSNNNIFIACGDGKVIQLQGHDKVWKPIQEVKLSGAITSLSISKDSKNLLAGSNYGKLYLIDTKTFTQKVIHTSHTKQVTCCAFDKKKSEFFVSGSSDGTIRLWSLNDYSLLFQTNINSKVNCILFIGDKLLSGSEDGFIRMFDIKTKKLIWQIVNAHKGGVTALCYHEKYISSGGKQGIVRIWSNTNHEMLGQFQQHTKKITGIIIDPKQPNILHSCSLDKTVLSFDLKSSKRIAFHSVSKGFGGWSSITQLIEGERELVVSKNDGTIFFWDIDYKEPVNILSEGQNDITSVSISPVTGKYLATAGSNQILTIWDWKNKQIISQGICHSEKINQLSWTPDEKQIVTVGDDCGICIWNFFNE